MNLQQLNAELIALIREIIPNLGTFWVEDYDRYDRWRKKAEKLLAEIDSTETPMLITLKPAAPDLVAMAHADEPINKGVQNGLTTDIKWPDSPKRCTCFTFGGTDNDFVCLECGGGRF